MPANKEPEEAVESTEARDMRVEGNDVDAYVGVDPMYMNYANETEKPYPFEDDEQVFQVEQQAEVQAEDVKAADSGEPVDVNKKVAEKSASAAKE
jgi:hypothetical protein